MLVPEKAVLVVIDVQQKLLPSIHDKESLLKQTALLVRGAHLTKIPILLTEQYPAGLGKTDPDVIDALGSAYQPIVKSTISSLGESKFQSALSATGRDQIILCGIEAHVCVYQTARDLLAEGKSVYLVSDCVSSRKESDKDIALRQMYQLGCSLSTCEMAVFELLKVSGTPEFKEWIRLIR